MLCTSLLVILGQLGEKVVDKLLLFSHLHLLLRASFIRVARLVLVYFLGRVTHLLGVADELVHLTRSL